jgi:hypothetical protein
VTGSQVADAAAANNRNSSAASGIGDRSTRCSLRIDAQQPDPKEPGLTSDARKDIAGQPSKASATGLCLHLGSWRDRTQPAVYKTGADRPRCAAECFPCSSARMRCPASAPLWGRVLPGGMTSRMTASSRQAHHQIEAPRLTVGRARVRSPHLGPALQSDAAARHSPSAAQPPR